MRIAYQRTAALIAVFFVGVVFSNSALAVTADLAADFSITTNGGSNPWSYGQYTSGLNPTTFTKFTVATPGVLGSLDIWGTTTASDPNIEKNVSGSDNTGCCSIDWPAGKVAFGPYLGPTVARWTAPVAGTYDITASFTTIQIVNTPPSAYIYVDGSQLLNAHLSDPGNTQFGVTTPFSANGITLPAGGTVDFVVWGDNNNNKTTEVTATINSVPEPTALAAFATMATLVLARRRPA